MIGEYTPRIAQNTRSGKTVLVVMHMTANYLYDDDRGNNTESTRR
jgi:hypothetical protein